MINKQRQWKQKTIGDILTLKYGKGLPRSRREDGPFPVIGSSGIIGYHSKSLIKGPGIIVGRKGWVGSVYYEKRNFYPIDTVFYVEVNNSDYDLRFIYYLLLNIDFQGLNSDTSVPGLNRNVAHRQFCLMPPLPVQRKIATILSAYDMIENNNRRIQILEEMAQTVYKEWFVKFRFPGYEDVKVERTALSVKMVDSELGEIPEGWEVKKFDEIFNIKYGKSLPIKKVSKSGRYPVYGAADIIGYYNEYVCQNKVALVTCRGNGSGDVRRTREPAFITNNSLMVFPKKKYSYWEYFFVELVLRNSNIMSIIGGSAQPQITIEGISTVKAIIPVFCIPATPHRMNSKEV